MNSTRDEERWAVWTVQAHNFAKRQNFTDAVARMRLVRDAVREALAQTTSDAERPRLERQLARAEEQLADLTAQYDAWRSRIAARRRHTIEHAAEEMERPLPGRAG